MKKAKKLSNKLMAALLSMAMVLTSILPSATVYAAEPGIEVQTDGAEDTASDIEVPDGIGTQDAVTDETGSGDGGSDEIGSGDETTGDTGSGNEGTGDTGSGSKETGDTGSESEDSGDTGYGSEGSGETDPENGDVDEEASGSEDTEGADENVEDEETDEELGEEIEAEDPLADLAEDDVRPMSNITVANNALTAGGWFESIYAEIADANVNPSDVSAVSYTATSGGKSGELNSEDLKFLVRKTGNVVRIDIPGVKSGTYTLTVKAGQSTLTYPGIVVSAYDRAGFAHFNYSRGVGAYNNDGTLKSNAEVIYVTNDNKNEVTLTSGSTTVTGIGNILNSVGQDRGGKTSNGGKPNTNAGIIEKIAKEGKPLVVRFIGTVSDSGLYESKSFSAASKSLIDGLTVYDSVDYGGSEGDNGHMARIQSGKDITLEGIGYDAVIDGWGFHFISEGAYPALGESFEVRNLKFINTPEDAIGMEGQQESKDTASKLSSSVERCWVHHNEFYCPNISNPAESDKSEGDGSVDFKRGQYFTCSYNYFEDCHKTNLVGSADYSLQFNLTYHHNYWYMCKARGPLTRNANVHMYNNIFDMQTDYAMNTRANAYIFSESNIFYACKSPQAVEDGAIKSYNDSISSALWKKGKPGTVVADKATTVANNCQFQAAGIKYDKFDTDKTLSYIPADSVDATGHAYYAASLQEDFAEMRKTIKAETGVQERTPKSASEVTPSDYSVVKRVVANPQSVELPSDSPVNLLEGKSDKEKKISKTAFAFYVGTEFDVTVKVSSSSKLAGVLVNEEGVNLLEIAAGGEESRVKLPAGNYMIQPMEFQPGDPKAGTIAVFKEIVLDEVTITKTDPNAHYHKYELESSTAPTCTGTGTNVYKCVNPTNDNSPNGKCDTPTKTETVAALGHSFGAWVTTKEATDTEMGERERKCSRCDVTESVKFEKGEDAPSGGGSTGGGSTVAGDYELYYSTKSTPAGDTDFFTVAGSGSDGKGSVTVNDVEYKYCLKMDSKGKVKFDCNDGAKLTLVFAPANSGQNVLIDGTKHSIPSDGIVELELNGGSHTVERDNKEIHLFYVALSNGASNEAYYTLSYDYNYDDAPEAKEVTVLQGTTYNDFDALVAAASPFTRSGYELTGLYTDASCSALVTYPYVVNSNARIYADWVWGGSDDAAVVETYSLIFESNGGSNIASVRVSSNQIYEITQQPIKDGYAFAGWYDALEGGNRVEIVDGSKLTGNYTVYAHWNVAEKVTSLNCATDLNDVGTVSGDERNITEKTTKNGFTIYALPGGGGAKNDSPKYYMTVKSNMLYTNGVLLTDKNIEGNTNGLLKSIEFTTEGPAALIVEVQLSGTAESGKTYELVLAKMENGSLAQVGKTNISKGTTKDTKIFNVDAEGTYYLYPQGDKGVAYTSLKVTEETYTILYNTDGGTLTGEVKNTAKAGETITLPSVTAPAGKIFKGWSINGGNIVEAGTTYTVSSDDAVDYAINISAVYEDIPYTLEFDAGDGELPDGVEDSIAVEVRQTIDIRNYTPTPPANEKVVFIGWKVDDSSDTLIKSYYLVKAEDADDTNHTITLRAQYGEACEVILDTNGGDLVNPNEKTAMTVEKGAQIHPGRCVKDGCKFVGWSVDGEIVELPYTVEEDVTLTAVYEEVITYTVKFDAGDGRLPANMHETVTAEAGDVIILSECTPETGFEFLGWTVGDSDEVFRGSYIVNAEHADGTNVITVKAKYVPANDDEVWCTVTLDPNGGTFVNGGRTQIQIVFKADEEIDLDQYPCEKDDCEFRGWSEDGVNIVDRYYTVTDNVTLIALYTDGSSSGQTDGKLRIEGLKGPFYYTGAKIIPDIKVYDDSIRVKDEDGNEDGVLLRPGIDYTVKYKDNTKVSTADKKATVIITGKGNYAGKDEKGYFTIEEDTYNGELLELKGAKLDKIEPVFYNTKAQYPDFTLTLSDKTVTTYTYSASGYYVEKDDTTKRIKAKVAVSNNTNKGTATILLTGAVNEKNKKATTVKKTFKINPVSISSAAVTPDPATYAAKGAVPSMTVTIEVQAGNEKVTKTLREGIDFTAKYSSNKAAGKDGVIKISGKGNYTGKVADTSFKINTLAMTDLDIAVAAYDGVKAEKVKATVLDLQGNALKASQYTVEVSNDANFSELLTGKLDAGKEVYVRAVAKDTTNLTANTKTESVKVKVGQNFAKVKVALKKVNNKPLTKPYTGGEITLSNDELEVTMKKVPVTEYKIVGYTNNVNKGTATAILQGTGEYTGIKTVKFKIVAKDMPKAEFVYDNVKTELKNFINSIFN